MKCELRIIGGARAGQRDVYDKSYIGIGRHPLSDVRFDAEKDLDASTRHAAIVKTGETYVLRDLGSTNGTFVNGEKLAGDRPLRDGDLLKFGVHGPEVSFHAIPEEHEGEVVMPAVQAPARKVNPTAPEGLAAVKRSATPPPPEMVDAATQDLPALPKGTRPPPPPPSKTSVLRAEISHQQSRFRTLAVLLFVLIIGALGIVYWQGQKSNAVIGQRDSVVTSLTRELAALRLLKTQTDSEKTALQTQLRSEHDPARRTQITARIATVEARSAAITQSQGVDYNAVRAANDRAVAQIFVRFADTTKMFAGTAFSVNTGGAMLTNKHTLTGENGETPRDIAVQFSGSDQVLPARLVRVAPDADLAVIQLESQGPFPAIAGFANAPAVEGAPIVLLGFPGGGRRATLVSGTVTRVLADSLYELDAFSGVGASGSPIFDREGKVLGIEFGGLAGSGGRAIVGLPISRAMGLFR